MKAVDKAEVREDHRSVPEVWPLAMKTHYPLAETISDKPKGALKFPTDIPLTYLVYPGFKLLVHRE